MHSLRCRYPVLCEKLVNDAYFNSDSAGDGFESVTEPSLDGPLSVSTRKSVAMPREVPPRDYADRR